jgi:hypothetical protein
VLRHLLVNWYWLIDVVVVKVEPEKRLVNPVRRRRLGLGLWRDGRRTDLLLLLLMLLLLLLLLLSQHPQSTDNYDVVQLWTFLAFASVPILRCCCCCVTCLRRRRRLSFLPRISWDLSGTEADADKLCCCCCSHDDAFAAAVLDRSRRVVHSAPSTRAIIAL